MERLGRREDAILDILISSYVRTGEPVGSRTISKLWQEQSAATVRNLMADLEEKGYVTQPHTSAGRIPTDKGYRYYVDKLMGAMDALTEGDQTRVREAVDTKIRERNVEQLLSQVSKVVADVSHNLGVVLSPRFERGCFERLELVSLSDSKLLLVLSIRSGIVRTMVMEIDSPISDSDLEETRRVVNERLSGLTVGEILASVGERLGSATSGDARLLRLLIDSAQSIFRYSSGDDLHVGGAGQFFLQPEILSDHQRLGALMGLLEERESMVALLDKRADTDGITVTIGAENPSDELQNCSLLTSSYRVGNVTGLIGLIGPTRLEYARLLPLVRYMSELTEEYLEEA